MYLPDDTDMLVSYINTQLRDNYDSLEDFCEAADIDKSELLEKLKKAEYRYDAENKKIR